MREAEGATAFGGTGAAALPRFAVAFQPIVDAPGRGIVGHEALLRGPSGSPAGGVLARVRDADRQRFEMEAIAAVLAAFPGAGAATALHVNISPSVLLRAPGTIPWLARMASAASVAPERIVIEVTEGERIDDADALAAAAAALRGHGLRIALDAFGTGYGGVGMLEAVRPDLVKLDMGLTRNIHLHRARRPIVAALLEASAGAGIGVVAVGVESEGEYRCLAGLGVTLFQGFLFSPPVTGRMLAAEEVSFPPSPPPLPAADPWSREAAAREH
jgi:EAL domain-containing protein (putative c-di-GMP-specific phosphodiesterase class I)